MGWGDDDDIFATLVGQEAERIERAVQALGLTEEPVGGL